MIKGLVDPCAIIGNFLVATKNPDPCASQDAKTVSRMPWIRIRGAGHYRGDSRRDDSFRAGRRPSVGGTWFERDVEGCSFGTVPPYFGVAQRFNFRMRQTRAPMPSAPDD